MGARHSASRGKCGLCSCFAHNHETEHEVKHDSPQDETVRSTVEVYQRSTPIRPMFQPNTENMESAVSSEDDDDVSYLSTSPYPFSRQANYSPLSSRDSLESEMALHSISDSSDDLPEPPPRVTVSVQDEDSVQQNDRFDVSTKPRIDCATKIIKIHYQDDPNLPEPSNSHHDLMAQFVDSKDIRTHGTQSGSGNNGGSKAIPRSWVGSKLTAPSATKVELPRYSRYVEYVQPVPVPISVISPAKAKDQVTNEETVNKSQQEEELKKVHVKRRGQNPALGYRSGWR